RGRGRLAEAGAIAERIAVTDRDAGAIVRAEVEIAAGNRAAAEGALATVDTDGKLAGYARRLAAEAALAADDPAAALAALGSPEAGADGLDRALVAAFALADLGRLREARARLAGFGAGPDAADPDAAQLARPTRPARRRARCPRGGPRGGACDPGPADPCPARSGRRAQPRRLPARRCQPAAERRRALPAPRPRAVTRRSGDPR